MNGTKPASSSFTIRSLVAAIIGLITIFAGPEIFGNETDPEYNQRVDAITEGVGGVVTLFGILGAAYGRYKATKQIAPQPPSGAPLLLILVLVPLAGCAGNRQEHQAWRDGFYNGTNTLRAEHLEWSRALSGVPGHELPNLANLTEEQRELWLKSRQNIHEQVERTYQADKANDAPLLPFGK